MSAKKSYITFKDQFCGAGGSSQAVKRLSKKMDGGLEVSIALNHNKTAIKTHSINFPNTVHVCADMSTSDPRKYMSTDFLITSPSCTEQGYASGKKKPTSQRDMFDGNIIDDLAERSRATMWDVPRFAEVHKYNYIIVENVWQARTWIQFDNWLRCMYTLGYEHKCVYFNSMFAYPCPQSRDRMFIHFWKKGNKAPVLDYYPKAHCEKCGKDVDAVQTWKSSIKKFGVYGKRGQYVYCCPNDGVVVNPYYYAALNAIDFNDIGQRIGDRKKPLVNKTMNRLLVGKEKLNDHPFFIQAEHSYQLQNIRSLLDVFPTQATRQTLGFAFPFIIENKGTSTGRSSEKPFSTMTCVNAHGILTPNTFKNFISYYYSGSDMSSSMVDPVNTFTTVQGCALVQPASKDINDWFYRMIKVNEGKKIMNFEDDYDIAGTSKEQFVQLGNAVTPSAMEWQIERGVQTFN